MRSSCVEQLKRKRVLKNIASYARLRRGLCVFYPHRYNSRNERQTASRVVLVVVVRKKQEEGKEWYAAGAARGNGKRRVEVESGGELGCTRFLFGWTTRKGKGKSRVAFPSYVQPSPIPSMSLSPYVQTKLLLLNTHRIYAESCRRRWLRRRYVRSTLYIPYKMTHDSDDDDGVL